MSTLSSSHNNTSKASVLRHSIDDVRDAVVDSDSDVAPSHREEGGASSSRRRNHHHHYHHHLCGIIDDENKDESIEMMCLSNRYSHFSICSWSVFDAQRARENKEMTRPRNIKQRRNKQQRCYQNERYFRCRTVAAERRGLKFVVSTTNPKRLCLEGLARRADGRTAKEDSGDDESKESDDEEHYEIERRRTSTWRLSQAKNAV